MGLVERIFQRDDSALVLRPFGRTAKMESAPQAPLPADNPRANGTADSVAFASGPRIGPVESTYLILLGFLWDEASALDANDYGAWLDMLSRDLEYTMPVRVTRRRGTGTEFHPQARHFDDTFASLSFRIKRFEETRQWAEDPPTRTRRFVTTVRAFGTNVSGDYDVASSLLLLRTQDDDYHVEMISAERQDRIQVDEAGQPTLARRVILPDQSTIGTSNLSIFL
jgi:3-phenylpropionate/cinnamic acid dioxygenase small subunit